MAIDRSVEFDFYRVHQDKKEDYKYQQYGQFIDVNVFQFGREKCRPSHSFGPAVRNHYLFHYILSGRGTLESTDRLGRIHSHQIGPGEGFMIVPQQINTYQADKEDPWEYIWLEFDGACISQPLFAAGLDFDHPVWRPGEDRNKTDMENRLDVDYISSNVKSVVYISAKNENGMDALSDAISKVLGVADLNPADGILSGERQLNCCRNCLDMLKEAKNALDTGMTLDAVNVSLDCAVNYLLELTGERATDVVTEAVFHRFCVGK